MKRTIAILLVAFAVLISLPWLVPHTGALSLVAFVPLLCAERLASAGGMKRFVLWYNGAFVLWNAFTTFWICNATVGGGIFAVLANAFQMAVIFGLFRLAKRRLNGILPYILLAAAWIAWERFYYSAQISWPWLVLGNAFARSTHSIQWYEYTGTLGGSLWIWISNLTVFGLMVSLSDGRFQTWNGKARAAAMSAATIVILGPFAVSSVIYRNYEEQSEGTVDILVGQPNFDPYHKFESMSQAEQNASLADLFHDALPDGTSAPQLFLAPETFTSDVVLNDVEASRTLRFFQSFLRDYPKSDFLLGASTNEFFMTSAPPSILARPYGRNWYINHNSAIITDSTRRTEICHKSKLVVGTELTPFPKLFVPIDNKLGGVMGRCVGQDHVTTLHLQDGTPIGCAICYESVYGEYCTGYVNAGAKMMTVITNDAWWGNTPGYRQHLSYSCLRAIELRRDVARCGNTGISAFIDQRGDVLESSEWWRPQTIRDKVNLNSGITFFARHGDIAGRVCTFVFIMLLLLYVVKIFTENKTKQ